MSAHTGRLGLGGADIGNHRVAMSDSDARALLEAAWAAGVRHFDTAPHYGLGLSERRLGDFLATKPREEFVVSTKVGRRLVPNPGGQGALDDEGFVVPATSVRLWDFSPEGIRASLAESLRRLQLTHVDVAYLHDPERAPDPNALKIGAAALRGLKYYGFAKRTGLASMQADTLLAAARSEGFDELMVAGRYTLMDHAATTADLLPACRDSGTTIVCAAVFNGGIGATGPGPHATFDYAKPDAALRQRAARIEKVCHAHQVPLATAALQFPLRQPLVRGVVVGAANAGQLLDNVRALAEPVPAALWSDLAEAELIAA